MLLINMGHISECYSSIRDILVNGIHQYGTYNKCYLSIWDMLVNVVDQYGTPFLLSDCNMVAR